MDIGHDSNTDNNQNAGGSFFHFIPSKYGIASSAVKRFGKDTHR